MSDTNRHIAPPGPHSRFARCFEAAPGEHSPARVEALRKLVAAGQYHVSPRWLATKIFRAAGVKVPE